jgi:hypothetical protein
MPTQPEAKFKARLVKAFREEFSDRQACGYSYVGVDGPGQKRGLPDLFFYFAIGGGLDGGRRRTGSLYIEAKVHPNILEPHQARTIAAMRNAGCQVIVATYFPEKKITRAEWSATERADFPTLEDFWFHV